MYKKIRLFYLLSVMLLLLLVGCSKSDMDYLPNEKFKISQTLSIFECDNTLGISMVTFNKDGIKTEFRMDEKSVSFEELTRKLPVKAHFETSINSNRFSTVVFRMDENKTNTYQFYKDISLNPYNQLFYIKNDTRMQLDTVIKGAVLGQISAVDVADGEEVFAGSFQSKVIESTPNGYSLIPVVPFVWNGEKIKKLPFPKNNTQFNGINAIHRSVSGDIYVAGIMKYPMYWKNNTPIKLSDYMGEVTQIVSVGKTIFAAGFINKYNSRDVNNTACYWKDGKIVELEEQAVATSIFIDGENIYVGGATGRTPDDFKACYWKNGKKIMVKPQ